MNRCLMNSRIKLGGVTGSYEATAENTILLDEVQSKIFSQGDTLIFDLGNIKTIGEINTCLIEDIKIPVDVIIYISGNPTDNTFNLDGYQNISSFAVRIPETSPLKSPISLNLNDCSNLTTIDCDRLLLYSVSANNSGLEGGLSFNNSVKKIYLSECGGIEYLNIDTGGAVEVLDISNTKLELCFRLLNTIFIEKPTINMSSNTSIIWLEIVSLDLTNITYPDNLDDLNLVSPIYDKLIDLTHLEKLAAFSLDYSDTITNIKFPSTIQVIQIAECPNLLNNQTFIIPPSTITCILDTCPFSSIVYNCNDENSPFEELQLYKLGNCKSININNANYYFEELDKSFTLSMLTESESTYQSTLDLSSFTSLNNLSITNSNISSIEGITSNNENRTLRTINLSNSTTNETLNIDFEKLLSIETLNLSNCETLQKINNSENYNFMLADYGSLKYLYLDGTKLSNISINNTNVVSNLNTLILPSEMTYLDIDGCKKLNNDYLAGTTITAGLTLANLGYNYPESLSNITNVDNEPLGININNTTWTNITLNGTLLKNEDNIIYIKYNKNLKSISFTDPLDEIKSFEIDISYNINLKTINGRSDITDILEFFNREPIYIEDDDGISKLDYNLSMNVFKSIDNPSYMGVWPQVEEWDGLSGRIYGIPNYKFTNSEVYNEYVGIDSRSTNNKLVQFSLNNITLWDSGDYSTNENLNALEFRNSLSLFFNIDEDGNVDDSVNIINNNVKATLIDIIDGLLSTAATKPNIIYTNSKTLKGIATDHNIPVQMLHIKGEDWKPRFVININLVSNN